MPLAVAQDGVELHWQETGSGPTVMLVPYWSMHPSVFDPLEAELAGDLRVVRFDDRGTGQSSRVGPYDMATGVEDLRLVCEAVGGVSVAVCLVDAGNRAVRVADEHPELLGSVVCMGSAPVGPGALSGAESLISSRAVVSAFLQQLESDHRGAIRSALAGANSSLTEEEVRERVQLQLDYIDGDSAAERARAWAEDEGGVAPGAGIGARLHVCVSESLGGPGSWFPSAVDMEPVIRSVFPGAGVTWTSDGIVSAPQEAAAVVRDMVEASNPDYHRAA